DLVYALLDGCELAILIDAIPRGERPGTLSIIEPDVTDVPAPPAPDGHSMDPAIVLATVRDMGGIIPRVLLVGCEPSPIDIENMQMELSPAVESAIERAVEMVETLITQFFSEVGYASSNVGLSRADQPSAR